MNHVHTALALAFALGALTPAEADAAVVYSELLAKGPVGEVVVDVRPAEGGGYAAAFWVQARLPDALPEDAQVQVWSRKRRGDWIPLELSPAGDEPGAWRGVTHLWTPGPGEFAVRVTSATGEVLQEVGTRRSGGRLVVFDPSADQFDMPPATLEDPITALDLRPRLSRFERVQVGLYPDDPVGTGAVVTVLARDVLPEDATMTLDWNPPGGGWEEAPMTRIGPRTWVVDVLPVPRGEGVMDVRLEQDGQLLARLSPDEELHVPLQFAPQDRQASSPAPPPTPDDDGFVTVYTEAFASGVFTDLRVAVAPTSDVARLVVDVGVDPSALDAAPEHVLLDLNPKGSSWVVAELRERPGTNRWRRVIRVPDHGPAYLALRAVDAEGQRLDFVGTRASGARFVHLDPVAERRDISATSVDRPQRLFAHRKDDGLIAFVEVAGFTDDPHGLVLRFRVQLRRPPPDGARIRAGFNGDSAPW